MEPAAPDDNEAAPMGDPKPTRAELGRGPRTRDERGLGDRPRSLRTRELVREARTEAMPLFDWIVRDELDEARPKTRGDCKDGPRPCAYASCRHHLFLEVKEDGRIRYTHPGKELEDLAETCALDVADRNDEPPLSTVADLLNITRESVAEIEAEVLQFLRRKFGGDEMPALASRLARFDFNEEPVTHTDEAPTRTRDQEQAELVFEQAFDDEDDCHTNVQHDNTTTQGELL